LFLPAIDALKAQRGEEVAYNRKMSANKRLSAAKEQPFRTKNLVARNKGGKGGAYCIRMVYMAALAIDSSAQPTRMIKTPGVFDTGAKAFRVENCATASEVSHSIDDFEGPLIKLRHKVKGLGGELQQGVSMGTLKLSMEESTIMAWAVHQHFNKLARSFHIIPTATSRAQVAPETGRYQGTWCARTFEDKLSCIGMMRSIVEASL